MQHDAVIIGAGTAGLMCAIAACERGARVLLLEKSGRIGGTLHLSSGMISAGGTRLQRERGIADSPDAHLADVLRIGRDGMRRDLVAWHCAAATALVDWLHDRGFAFADGMPVLYYGHEPYSVPRTVWGVRKGRSILDVLERELAPHVASGRCELRLNTAANALIVEAGRMVGVQTSGTELRAPIIVVAAGGYGRNPILLDRFSPTVRHTAISAATSTGDGLLLAEQAGAAISTDAHYQAIFCGIEDADEPGVHLQTDPDVWDPKALLVPQYRAPWELWMNARGERFIREDEPSADARERALLAQPDLTMWTVFDERALRESPPLVPAWTADELRAHARHGRFAWAAPSIESLALASGLPPAVLAETVATYNTALDGADPLGRAHRPAPLREPPFYAIRHRGVDLAGWAGIAVGSDLRVLRPDGSAIEGLYAVGEALGARAFFGEAFVGGMLVGPALTFGRRLGEMIGSTKGA